MTIPQDKLDLWRRYANERAIGELLDAYEKLKEENEKLEEALILMTKKALGLSE